jgi:FkbM family methyltransferase
VTSIYKKTKHTLGQIPFLVNVYRALPKKYHDLKWFINYELKDIWDSYLSKSKKAQITPFGFKLVGSSSIHHIAMQNGTFEPEETALFKELFHQSDIFVDIGSNIGFYTCLARSTGIYVLAIEPLPNNLKYLFANLLINNWDDVEVFPVGLGEHPGLATLFGASSTGASLIGNWAGASQIFHRTISLSTLDILLGERFNGKKIFIKIDVEGFEYPVLLGAVAVMQRQPKPTWVVEVSLNNFHPDGMNSHFKDVFNLFWRYGYEARTADRSNKLIEPADIERWVNNGSCDSGTINYKFVPLVNSYH